MLKEALKQVHEVKLAIGLAAEPAIKLIVKLILVLVQADKGRLQIGSISGPLSRLPTFVFNLRLKRCVREQRSVCLPLGPFM